MVFYKHLNPPDSSGKVDLNSEPARPVRRALNFELETKKN